MTSSRVWLIFIFGLYAFLHIAKIEIFPFYTFGMYSEKKAAIQEYYVYRIKADGFWVDYSTMNYRRYVYITNTIKAYDRIIKSANSSDPSSAIISKYISRLPLQGIERQLNAPHRYQEPQKDMRNWLKSIFPERENIEIFRETYQWKQGSQEFIERKKLLP